MGGLLGTGLGVNLNLLGLNINLGSPPPAAATPAPPAATPALAPIVNIAIPSAAPPPASALAANPQQDAAAPSANVQEAVAAAPQAAQNTGASNNAPAISSSDNNTEVNSLAVQPQKVPASTDIGAPNSNPSGAISPSGPFDGSFQPPTLDGQPLDPNTASLPPASLMGGSRFTAPLVAVIVVLGILALVIAGTIIVLHRRTRRQQVARLRRAEMAFLSEHNGYQVPEQPSPTHQVQWINPHEPPHPMRSPSTIVAEIPHYL